MSGGRACLPCRSAKAKCDLVRPACGRCVAQRIQCPGNPLEDVFVFRNENEVAKRNSQRARRPQGWKSFDPIAASSSSLAVVQSTLSQTTGDAADDSGQKDYSWLNEYALGHVPEPLKRDVETRAVERFFVNWILHPSNHGGTPGHMHELPMLFQSAEPDSVLWLAIRAVAFADLREESAGNVPFHIKARHSYGAALTSMRAIIADQQNLDDDHILSAMLLIDNFELMYLARNDLSSPHGEAIRHVLHRRGEQQLYSPTRFSLWRLTHYRLQFWQTLFREQPDAEQIEWIRRLNIDRPDLRICTHVLHMNVLSASARTLTEASEGDESLRLEKAAKARELAQEMQDLLVNVETWASEMTEVWKPKEDDPMNIVQAREAGESPTFPIPRFPYPRLLTYDDLWLAYIWNFYAASQIVLRESLIDVLLFAAAAENRAQMDESDRSMVQKQHEWIGVLSVAVLSSFPQLLGFTYSNEEKRQSRQSQQGKMAGRLFALFSMWVIQLAKFTSSEHKKTAAEVVAWINTRHGLS